MSEEFAKIFPSRLQGEFVSFVQTPTQYDKRLIVMVKDSSKRVVQCETCGNTEHMQFELFGNQTINYQKKSEADKYYVRCDNPKCSARHGGGFYITASSSDSKLLGRLRNRLNR